MTYWLLKTEPEVFGIEDLAQAPGQTTRWDGIRNYQARNLLRDQVQRGDLALIYHSQCRPTGIVGLTEVVSDAYPDPAQFEPESPYFDPKATPEAPRWYSVDLRLLQIFPKLVTLAEIKQTPALQEMVLLKQPRLSVQPVSEAQAQQLLSMTEASAYSKRRSTGRS